MTEWATILSDLVKKHGFITVLSSVLVGVGIWQGWSITGDLKESQRYTRDKLTVVTEQAVKTTAESSLVIEASTRQGEKVEAAIKSNTRMLGKVLTELKQDPEGLE